MQRRVCVVFSLAIFMASPEISAATRSVERLPTPPGLEADVKFWEDVFSRYKPDQCVFHDKDDLSIVYVAKTLPGSTPSQRARMGRRYLNAIRAGLKHLASGGAPRNRLERRLEDVTPRERRSEEQYAEAMNGVRCQRGVDLSNSLANSRRHIAMVKRVLRQRRLPPDLAYLPHLESGYNPLARSRVGARGIWQLMPATAREAGLTVGRRVDHRTSPERSTRVAAKMLASMFESTGSWPLAITGYNYGPNGVRRAVKAWGSDYMTVRMRHKTSIFGFAARNYFPSFLAARNVALRRERTLAVE